MSDRLGPISVEFLINNKEFAQHSDKVRDNLKGITSTAKEESNKVDQLYRRLGTALAAYFSFEAAKGFITQVARVRGEFQQLEVSLNTILGSKEKADQLLAQVVDLAAKTPFSLTELAQGSKLLLAYGFESASVTDTLRRLGDVASGLNIPFNELNQLYGKSRVEGRLFAEDLNQFTGRGIPIIGELAEIMGVAESEVRNLVTAGKVGFPEVEQAIRNMTDEGGAFFNLMEQQSQTITGKVSNLGDAFDRMYNDIGQANEGLISDTLDGLINLVDNYQKVIDILKVAAITYGTYRAAIMLTAATTRAMALANAGYTASQILLNTWTVIATRAQRILNATMLANPYVAAATALAALIAATQLYGKSKDQVVKVTETFKNSINEEIKASNDLFKSLKDTNQGTEDRAKMIEKVNDTYGKYLPKQLNEKSNLEQIEKAQNAVNTAIAESIFLRSQESDISSIKDKTQEYAENFGSSLQSVIDDAELAPAVGGQLSAALEQALENAPVEEVEARLKKVLAQFGIDFSKIGRGTGAGANSISTDNYKALVIDSKNYVRTIDNEKKATQDLAEAKEGYLRQLGLINDEQSEETANTEEQITTLKTLKDELKDLQESRESIDITDTQALAKNERAQLELRKKIGKLEIESAKEREKETKKTELELLKGRLDEKRKAYEDYYTAIELLGKESADELFEDLRKEGGTYLEYLKKVEAGINPESQDAGRQQVLITQEVQRASGSLSPLEQLREEIDEMKQVYADFETYKEQFGIEAARKQFAGQLGEYEDYLDFVRQKTLDNQDAFTGILDGTATVDQKEIAKLLQQEADEAIRINQQTYNEQLAQLQTYNDERERLIRDYEALRQELIRKGNLEEASELDRKHQQELDALDDANLKKLQSYKEVYEQTGQLTKETARAAIVRIRELLANESMSDELRNDLQVKLANLQQEIEKTKLDDFYKLGIALNSLGQSLINLGEASGSAKLANFGSLLSGLSAGVNDLLTAFDSEASNTDKIASGINGIVRLTSMLAQAATQRKLAEEAYYRSVIGFQNQYNLSLNEQLRLQSMLSENVFLTDYEGRIRDGVTALNDANRGYIEAIDALAEAQAKSGMRNAVDWGSVGAGASAGAGIGAAVGSIVPVIGTAIGALVGGVAGAITGLFGGKKKVDNLLPLLEEYPELITMTEEGLVKVNKELAESLLANDLLAEGSKELVQNVIDWEEAMEAARQQIRDVVSELVGSLGGDLRNALVDAFAEGENAAVRMGETVEKVLENVVSQLLFNQIFSGVFDKLQTDLEASIGAGDTEALTSDLENFFNTASSLSGEFNDALKEAQKAADQAGFDIFQPEGSTSSPTGLGGAIRRELTEATGSELAGLFRGFYDISSRTLTLSESRFSLEKENYSAVLSQLQHQAAIESNTADTVARLQEAVVELKAINKNTKSGSMRGYTA